MIVVVASVYDDAARSVVARWDSQRATMLTAEDLCRPGWTLQLPTDRSGNSVIDGSVVPNGEIGGVLTLRSSVLPAELRSIRREDRQYVSSELNAFLLVWLTSLNCRVVNRPSAMSLAGPNWRQEQWTVMAASLGIPVQPRRRTVPETTVPPPDDTVEVIVAGDRCFAAGDAELAAWSRQLAQAAAVDLLSVRFSIRERRFCMASPWPALTDPAVFEAARACVEGS